MRENVTQLFTGHVQIHALDFERTLSTELTVTDLPEVLEKLKNNPLILATSRRAKCEALVARANVPAACF